MSHRNSPQIQGIVFDLDGTLVDTEQLGFNAFLAASKRMNLNLSTSVYFSMMGLNRRDALAMLRQSLPKELFQPFQELRKQLYLDALELGVPLRPGALESLDFARQSGLRCALATSSTRDEMSYKVENARMSNFFDFVCTGDDIERGKPAPDIFERAAAGLGLDASSCLAVEDSEPGVLAATQAGMPTVIVPHIAPIRSEIISLTAACLKTLHELPSLIANF